MEPTSIVVTLFSLPRRTVVEVVHAPTRIRSIWTGLQTTGTLTLSLVQRGHHLLDRIDAAVDDINAVVSEVGRVTDAARASVDAATRTSADIEVTNAHAAAEIRRVEQLLDVYGAPLVALAPLVSEAASALTPAHIRALGRLLDLVPDVAELVDPALRNLADLAPDVEQLIERMNNVGQVVEGIPGAGLLRRRTQAAEDDDD